MLTGKTRFRTGMWGKMILQVEYIHTSYDAYGGPERKNPAWRDATIQDFPGKWQVNHEEKS